MSLQLRPDELLTALRRSEHPHYQNFEMALFGLLDAMGDALMTHVPNLKRNPDWPTNEWDDMVCTPIQPIDPSLPIPEPLKGLDDGGWDDI